MGKLKLVTEYLLTLCRKKHTGKVLFEVNFNLGGITGFSFYEKKVNITE